MIRPGDDGGLLLHADEQDRLVHPDDDPASVAEVAAQVLDAARPARHRPGGARRDPRRRRPARPDRRSAARRRPALGPHVRRRDRTAASRSRPRWASSSPPRSSAAARSRCSHPSAPIDSRGEPDARPADPERHRRRRPPGSEALDVAVDGETIAALGTSRASSGRRRAKVIDATGCLVIPGGIDPHVHYAMNFEGLLDDRGPAVLVRRGARRQHDASSTSPSRSRRPGLHRRDRDAQGGARRARWPIDYVAPRDPHAGLLATRTSRRSATAIRDGIPTIKTMMTYGWMSDDGRRYGADVRGRRARRHERRARRGRRDRQLAHRQVHPRGQDPRRLHLRGARPARRGGGDRAARCSSPSAPARRCTSCTWPPAAAIEALAEARARGLPIYGETLSAYLSFTQDDLWDESPIEVDGKTYNARGAALQQLPDAEVRAGPRHLLGGDHRRPAPGRRAPTTRSSSLKDRFETMGTTIDSMQAGQAAVELRVPLLYYRGRGQRPDQRRALGRADLDEPGEAHGHVAAQGPDRRGRRRRHRRLRPRASSWTVRLAGPAHERAATTAGTAGSSPARCATRSCAGRCSSRTGSSWARGPAAGSCRGRCCRRCSPATSGSARSRCEDRLREAACVAGGVEVAGEGRDDGRSLEQDERADGRRAPRRGLPCPPPAR